MEYRRGVINLCLSCERFAMINCGFLNKRKSVVSEGYIVTPWCPGYNQKIKEQGTKVKTGDDAEIGFMLKRMEIREKEQGND